jgi:hypothetical protein
MKNKISNIIKTGMLLGFTAATALCLATPVRAGTSKSSHHGGPGSGSGGGTFYATVSNVSQLIADINYADSVGGTFNINLQPNTAFNAGQPLSIGNTHAVHLTILGNGDTLDGGNGHRLFLVAPGSSLTLVQMTLQNGYMYAGYGGAILNDLVGYSGANGMLTISHSTVTNNWAYASVVDPDIGPTGVGGGIYNRSGTVMISDSSLTGNYADALGGGLANGGTVTVEDSTQIFGNTVDDAWNSGTLYLQGGSTIDVLAGNAATPIP